jgi:arsenate reductase
VASAPAATRPAALHPFALRVLEERGLPTAELRGKSWDEFAGGEAPVMEFVFTVCDKAAGEACPVWPGRPMTAHRGVEDPAAVQGTQMERLRVFERVVHVLEARIRLFLALRPEHFHQMSLKRQLDQIGRSGGEDK